MAFQNYFFIDQSNGSKNWIESNPKNWNYKLLRIYIWSKAKKWVNTTEELVQNAISSTGDWRLPHLRRLQDRRIRCKLLRNSQLILLSFASLGEVIVTFYQESLFFTKVSSLSSVSVWQEFQFLNVNLCSYYSVFMSLLVILRNWAEIIL